MKNLGKLLKKCFGNIEEKFENMKKVLVLMATYNGKKYILDQLDSIWNQENVNISVLVRDDGSTDGTKEILDSLQKEGKLEWYTGEHLNVAMGYFDLMCRAEKYDVDYIAFSDQDDVWDLDKLYIGVKSLDKLSSDIPALYYCGQNLVDADLNMIAKHELNRKRSLETRFVLSDFAGCTGIFNKKLLSEVIKFKPTYMMMHDTWILKVCLCLGGQVIVDPKAHMKYRQHEHNTLGLGRSIPAYIKQVKQYLNEYHVEKQMHELLRGYKNVMVPEYKNLAMMICAYRENKKYRKALLDRNYINFYNKGLNFTYWLKVRLNKL